MTAPDSPTPASPAPESTAPHAPTPDPWALLARIRRPQGRKGEVLAEILTDFPEKFAERRSLWLLPDPKSPRLKSNPAPLKDKDSSKGTGSLKGTASPKNKQSQPDTGSSPQANPAKPASAPAPEGRKVELVAHWLHKGAIVLHFEGISSITAAEALTGLLVAIPRAERTPLADDEFYIADLAGCTLIDVAPPQPVIVGVIEDIDRTAGPIPLLIIRGPAGEVLVPFAKTFLRRVDLAAHRVEMALPAGLTTLNTPDAPKP
jgi:16S rRNA processing protein RimM